MPRTIGLHISGRWVGPGYNGEIMSGWGSMGQTREESKKTMARWPCTTRTHPDGSYEMCNLVLAFEPPRVISWKPG
jgi:hypothetical protein